MRVTRWRARGKRRRRAAFAVSAVSVLAGVAGCGASSSAPAALAVRCAGSSLSAPDSSEIDASGPVLPPPVQAVRGVPRPAGTVRAQLPSAIDPGDPRYGYLSDGWRVARVNARTGRPVWSVSLPGAAVGANPNESRIEYLFPHAGYVIVVGEDDPLRGTNTPFDAGLRDSGVSPPGGGVRPHDYVAAVSASGRVGPVCALPEFQATDGHVELLPHAGVVVVSNPAQESGDGHDAYLEGYAVTTGKRLWSVSSHSSDAGGGASYVVAGDEAFVWQGRDGRVAAYDTRTGQRSWLADPGTEDPDASDNGLLGAADGRVYAQSDRSGTSSSQLVALGAGDGKLLWKRAESQYAEFGPSRHAAGANVLVPDESNNGKAYLVDSRTGRTLASQPAGGGQPALCYPGGVPAVALVGPKRIYVLSADPGYNRTFAIPGGVAAEVDITATMAYVSPQKKGAPVYGYDLATGKLAWKVNVPGSPAERWLRTFDGGFAVVFPHPRDPSRLFS